jgi:hypothetical protein
MKLENMLFSLHLPIRPLGKGKMHPQKIPPEKI